MTSEVRFHVLQRSHSIDIPFPFAYGYKSASSAAPVNIVLPGPGGPSRAVHLRTLVTGLTDDGAFEHPANVCSHI